MLILSISLLSVHVGWRINMQPSTAMQDIIEQGYHLFRRYRVPPHFNVCCHYCFSAEQQQALRQSSIRAVPFELMKAWNSSINPEAQDSDEIRYLLPRLLELIARREFPGLYEGSCLQRVGKTETQRWRADERLFLQHFGQQFMRDWLLVDDVVELGLMLEMFWVGGLEMAPLLDAVLEVPGYWATVSLAYLLYMQRKDDLTAPQIRAWAVHARPRLIERAERAIMSPMTLPQVTSSYSAEVDSWMIDECLCAMHSLDV